MSVVRHLANAPIKEALVDIRVDLPPEFSAAGFRDVRDAVGPVYARIAEAAKQETTIQFDSGAATSATSREFGLYAVQFISEKNATVAQFRADGFTFNKLRPYTDWASIAPEALRLWDIYSTVARPAKVSRASVRYINEFTIPVGLAKFAPYLRIAPPVSPGAPGNSKAP